MKHVIPPHHPRMIRARSVLIMDHPFYGSLVMRLLLVSDARCPTLATDGTHLYYNPAYVDTLTDAQLLFMLAHEVLHCALGHVARRGTRDHLRYNMATDYAINIIVTDAEVGSRHPDWLYDTRFRGFDADQIYRILEEEEKKKSPDADDAEPDHPNNADEGDQQKPADEKGDAVTENDGDQKQGVEDGVDEPANPAGGGDSSDPTPSTGQSGTGGGVGENGAASDGPEYHGGYPGGCGEVLDAAPAHDKAALDEAAEEWATHTRQAVNIARKIGEGKLPGDLEQVIDDLERTRTDWRDALQRFVDPSSSRDYTWSKPNMRHAPFGYITPGFITDGVSHIAMLIDTSGSIDQVWLRRFGSEIQTALDTGIIDKLTLVFGDTDVRRTAEYNKGDIIDFTCAGRGGTEFVPLIEWVSDNAPDVAAAIYFTDLDCSDFGEPPPFPMLWAAYGDPRSLKSLIPRVPFGEVVELTD